MNVVWNATASAVRQNVNTKALPSIAEVPVLRRACHSIADKLKNGVRGILAFPWLSGRNTFAVTLQRRWQVYAFEDNFIHVLRSCTGSVFGSLSRWSCPYVWRSAAARPLSVFLIHYQYMKIIDEPDWTN